MAKTCYYVLSYDIPDDKRRTRLAKTLEGWGQRVQYSVFEIGMQSGELQALCDQIAGIVSDEDQIRVYNLCAQCLPKTIIWGQQPLATHPDHFLI